MPKEYEADDELEKEAYEILRHALKRAKRQKHWHWRLWEWLKAVRWCLKMAYQEFIDVYHARNE